MEKTETILFIDHVGFNIVGEKVSESDKTITVKNPAVLQAAPNQQNQLQVQLLPVLFKEFLDTSNRDKGVSFTYNKDKIVISDATLDSRLKQQYTQMFGGGNTPEAATGNDVIKLFDE
jgi:hypothetical protein